MSVAKTKEMAATFGRVDETLMDRLVDEADERTSPPEKVDWRAVYQAAINQLGAKS